MRCGSIVLLSAFLLVAGCASSGDSTRGEMTESLYYQQAHKQLAAGHYNAAITDLKDLKARFPYSDYAEQAQIDLIYANYQIADFANTVAAAQLFLTSYPTSKQTDYVLYLQGLGNYRLTESVFGRFLNTEPAAHDLSAKRDAFNNFAELVRRFPSSQYAPDARSRMVFIRQLLAEHNLEVARYYAKREAFIAAADRAQRVVKHFDGTPQVEEALAILSRSYTSLQQPALAKKSQAVLAYNWPKSKYLDNGKVDIGWWPHEKSWLELLTFDLL